MSLNFNDIIKQGVVKVKRDGIGLWKTRWLIFRKASSKGPLRIDSYKDERASALSDEAKKVIKLNSVRSIGMLAPDVKRNAIGIVFHEEKPYHLALDTNAEAANWLSSLQQYCATGGWRDTMPSGMDLLSSASDALARDTFNVYILPTPCLAMYGECLLQVTTETLYLLDITEPTKRIIGWPLPSLRRYSQDDSKFTFEAGRSCPTGEGLFVFNTLDGELIFQRVQAASLAIAEVYRMSDREDENRSQTLPRPTPPGLLHSDSLPAPGRLPPRSRNSMVQQAQPVRPLPPLPPVPPAH